jgi:hypothetical protein
VKRFIHHLQTCKQGMYMILEKPVKRFIHYLQLCHIRPCPLPDAKTCWKMLVVAILTDSFYFKWQEENKKARNEWDFKHVSSSGQRPTRYWYSYEVCIQNTNTPRYWASEVFTVVFCDVTSCGLIMVTSVLEKYTTSIFEVSQSIYRTINRHIPEDRCFRTCISLGRHRVNYFPYYGNYELWPDICYLVRNIT